MACFVAIILPTLAKEKDCCWIDVKTGKRVRSIPIVPVEGASHAAKLSADGKTAFNPITKRTPPRRHRPLAKPSPARASVIPAPVRRAPVTESEPDWPLTELTEWTESIR